MLFSKKMVIDERLSLFEVDFLLILKSLLEDIGDGEFVMLAAHRVGMVFRDLSSRVAKDDVNGEETSTFAYLNIQWQQWWQF